MKTKIPHLILAGLFGTALASQGATVSLNFGSTVDDGTLDEETETWTANITNFAGTSISFDLIVTGVTPGNTWAPGGAMAIAGSGPRNDRVDGAGEDGDFSLAIANFNPGGSGTTQDIIGFGFSQLNITGAAGATDSGTFSLLNGAAPSSSLTWTNGGGGADFTGMLSSAFNLQLMNDTYGSGEWLTSFSHDWAGSAWRYTAIELEFQIVPEPSSTALLGLGLSSMLLRRRRS